MDGAERISISRKDLYCIARLLKGANYALIKTGGGGLFDKCESCRFRCRTEENPAPTFDRVGEILKRETGVTIYAPEDWPEKWPPRGAVAKRGKPNDG